MVMLVVDDLDLQAGNRILLEKLKLTIAAGQCWFVYGCNGAGKTTLLQTLAGLRRPDGGKIVLEGKDLADWQPRELARKRAYLPQAQQDAFGFTVLETVLAARFPWRSGKMVWEGEGTDDHDVAVYALKRMDVLKLARRDIRSLSGGERQRVAIAALLAQDTPLMLLDEPVAALDLAHQAALMRTIAGLGKDEGRAVVMVVHDLNLAWNVATHVLLVYGDGQWEAGTCGKMMTPEKLSRCLHYPVEKVAYGNRPVFVSF